MSSFLGKMFEIKDMFVRFETDKLDEMHKLAQDKGYNSDIIFTIAEFYDFHII